MVVDGGKDVKRGPRVQSAVVAERERGGRYRRLLYDIDAATTLEQRGRGFPEAVLSPTYPILHGQGQGRQHRGEQQRHGYRQQGDGALRAEGPAERRSADGGWSGAILGPGERAFLTHG